MARPKKINPTVEALSERFPKFTKIQYTMVNNPSYGVWYSKEAEKVLKEKNLLPKKKRAEPKKKQKRISLRFSEEAYKSIQETVAASGCKSIQSFFEQLVRDNVS